MKTFSIITAAASTAVALFSMRTAYALRRQTDRTQSIVIYNNSQPREEKAQSDEDLKIRREDYYKDVDRKDKDRLFTESRFGSDLGFLMKILFSVQSIGIAALFYKAELNEVSVMCLICLISSLFFISVAFVSSLIGLSKWSCELTQLDKKYEDMKCPTNFYQHLFIFISFACMLIAFIIPIIDFYGK